MITRRASCLSFALMPLVLLCGTASPSTAKPVVVKLGTVAPEGSSWHDVLLRIRQRWHEISGGRVELRIYAGGVLGGEVEMVRKAQRREIDAVALSGAGLPTIDKSVACLNIPLLFESYEELDYVRSRMAPELEKRIESASFKVLNWSDAGWVHFFTKKAARTPDDIRKMKLWTSSGDPDTERLFKDLRFRVVPLPASDLLISLQSGMIEAIDVPPLFALLDRSYLKAGYMTDIKWAPLIAGTVIGTAAWERIPEGLRPELLEAARRAGEELRDEIRKAGADAVKEMKARGLHVIELDEAARRVWRAEAEESYPKLRGTLAPADLFDEVVRLRDEFRAARRGR